jgi:transcriptional regulator with XRE-family HTH domain
LNRNLKTFGGRLFIARCAVGLDLKRLAKLADVPLGRADAWEANNFQPNFNALQALRMTLGVTYGYLLGERYDVEHFAHMMFPAA